MYDLIESNKRKSWILIILFVIIIIILGVLMQQIFDFGTGIITLAALFSLISVSSSFFFGDKMILASVHAKQININDDPELFRIVENLSITAGIPVPKIYIIPDMALNAFATGRNPEKASVAITAGLRKILEKNELEAVMGHELSHVKNYDIRLMLLAAILAGMIIFIADILWRSPLRHLSNSESRKNNLGILLIPAIFVAVIGAPIAAQLIKLAISRKREFLADSSSVMLTRYPEAMISALQKISQSPTIQGHNEAIAHLFIYSPLKQKSFTSKIFSTHPPIEERIQAIQSAVNIQG